MSYNDILIEFKMNKFKNVYIIYNKMLSINLEDLK